VHFAPLLLLLAGRYPKCFSAPQRLVLPVPPALALRLVLPLPLTLTMRPLLPVPLAMRPVPPVC
jgi:hypothetical protein